MSSKVAALFRRSVDGRRRDRQSTERQSRRKSVDRSSKRVSWTKRLSFMKGSQIGNVGNDTIRFDCVSLKWLIDFQARVERGEEAPGVNLVQLTSDQKKSGLKQGTTGWVVMEENGKSTLAVPGSQKHVRVPTSSLKQKSRAYWSVQDVEHYVVKPFTQATQNPFFADALDNDIVQANANGTFVSVPSSAVFKQLVRSLEYHFTQELTRSPQDCFVWLRIFNTAQVVEDNSEEDGVARAKKIGSGLSEAMRLFEQRLCFFESWNNPALLESPWGIFDFHLCGKENLSIQILTSAEVKEAFVNEAICHANMAQELSRVKSCNADSHCTSCCGSADKSFVDQEITVKYPGRHQELNLFIISTVREWMSSVALQAVNKKRTANRALHQQREQLDFASLLNNCAILLEELGKWEECLEAFKEALYLFKVCLGEKSEKVASVLNHMGNAYQQQGLFEESLAMYEESLELCKELQGDGDLSVADVMTNLARLHLSQGNLDDALAMSSGALQVYSSVLGSNSESAAHAYSNLAEVFAAKGDFEEALKTHQKALQIFKDRNGPKHQSVADTLRSRAEVYSKQGSVAVALALYDESILITIDNLGEAHPKVASSMLDLSSILADEGKLEGAMDLAEQATKSLLRFYGPTHQHTVLAKDLLAKLHAQSQKA